MDEIGLSRSVDLVSKDVFVECSGDSLVKAGEQLRERFAITAPEHGDTMATLSGDSNASDRLHDADGDLAMVNKVGDIGQAGRIDRGVPLHGRMSSAFTPAGGMPTRLS
jgi:hypothetical protein